MTSRMDMLVSAQHELAWALKGRYRNFSVTQDEYTDAICVDAELGPMLYRYMVDGRGFSAYPVETVGNIVARFKELSDFYKALLAIVDSADRETMLVCLDRLLETVQHVSEEAQELVRDFQNPRRGRKVGSDDDSR